MTVFFLQSHFFLSSVMSLQHSFQADPIRTVYYVSEQDLVCMLYHLCPVLHKTPSEAVVN